MYLSSRLEGDSRIGLRGLERANCVVVGGMNIGGSAALGLRRRAIVLT